MKIVHLCISAFYIDNCSYQENLLPKYHAKMGYDVTIIASLATYDKDGNLIFLDKPSEYTNSDGIKVYRLGYKKPFVKFSKLLLRYQGLYKLLESEAPDIIFSHNIVALDMLKVVRYVKRHPGVKLFGDNHLDYINNKPSDKFKLIQKAIHSTWVYCTKQVEKHIIRCYGVTPMRCRYICDRYHLNPDKVAFLPMGIDDEAIPQHRDMVRRQIRTELHIKADDFVIFTGGKIDRLKNTHILVEAFSKISRPDVHLIICGLIKPEMSMLLQQIDQIPQIHYLGWCNAERIMNCMVASDLACFPGTHSTLWEQSVGIGLPAIFKRWPEMEHVNVNNNCLFVNGSDPEELRKAIETLLIPDNYSRIAHQASAASIQFRYSEIARKAIQV